MTTPSKRDGPGQGSVLHRLSTEPGSTLGERLLHHGARIFLLLVVVALVLVLFPPASLTDARRYEYEIGTPAEEDVIAEVPFSVPKTPAELDRERTLAMQVVPPTLDFIAAAPDSMASRVTGFFTRLDSAAAAGQAAGLSAVLNQSSVALQPSQVRAMLDEDVRGLLRGTALRASRQILPRGVLDVSLAPEEWTTQSVTVREGDGSERSMPSEDVLTSTEFVNRTVELLPDTVSPDIADAFRLMLLRFVEVSLVPNVDATEQDRQAAANSVEPVKAEVLEGQAIVRRGAVINANEAQWLDAYEAELTRLGLLQTAQFPVGPLVGDLLLHVVLLGIFGLVLYLNRPVIYGNFRWLLLIALLAATYFGAAAAIAAAVGDTEGIWAAWLPIAFVALPVAVLWDTRTSLVLVTVLAVISGTLPPFADYGTVLVVMASGAAAALSARALRRRSETWVSIALISGTAGLVLLAHGLTTSEDMGLVAQGTVYAAGNATVSALLAMGFLWVFELITGITTDQTLLEWADPTRPLLKKLSFEAPGTYAHTISVANLSEAAATAIGANSLLCRVGVYYHDVGKMLKPHYFVENQPDGRNPHDKLKPGTSADIVREHVTEGAKLAREENVPEVIVRFILEHHGTQRIGYFYEKAVEEAAEGEEVDVDRFSYPGPRPRSRETAIVMLADSCESAARAMQDPTPERLRDLIDTIVDAKIADGQLDDAPLTLGEVSQVKDQFVNILTGVIHRRIEYPATKHLTDPADNGGDATGDQADRNAPPRKSASA